jgi:hypothetical protein
MKFRNKKEVPVWYTGIYRPILNAGIKGKRKKGKRKKY